MDSQLISGWGVERMWKSTSGSVCHPFCHKTSLITYTPDQHTQHLTDKAFANSWLIKLKVFGIARLHKSHSIDVLLPSPIHRSNHVRMNINKHGSVLNSTWVGGPVGSNRDSKMAFWGFHRFAPNHTTLCNLFCSPLLHVCQRKGDELVRKQSGSKPRESSAKD